MGAKTVWLPTFFKINKVHDETFSFLGKLCLLICALFTKLHNVFKVHQYLLPPKIKEHLISQDVTPL